MTPVSKAGRTTLSADQPSTQASATVSAPKTSDPSVEIANIRGSRRIATPSTPKPVPEGAAAGISGAGCAGGTSRPTPATSLLSSLPVRPGRDRPHSLRPGPHAGLP